MDGLLQKTFTFDATNMLSKVVDSNKGEVENQYNGLGFRVASTRPEEKIEYLCDLSRDYYNLLERTVNGETESFIYDNNVVSMSKAGSNYYYLQDELGSPMYMTGTDGVAVSSYAFDDFGRNVDPFTGKIKEANHKHSYTTDGNIIQPFAFTGYQEDEVSDLKFAQARFYSAENGRFVGEDQIGGYTEKPDTINHFVYCWNNPKNLIDKNGKFPQILIGAAVGGIIGAGVDAISQGVAIAKGEQDSFNWGELAGATVEGAVVGAVASTGVGAGLAGAMLAGGLGAAAGNVTTQLINTGSVDGGQLALATGAGVIGGAAGYGIGKAISKVSSKVMPKIANKIDDFVTKRRVARGGASVNTVSPKQCRLEMDLQFFAEKSGGCPYDGGAESKFREVFDLADNYKLSDETFNNHILDRHGPNSVYGNKSHFNANFDIREGINSTLTGNNFTLGPNTAGRDGYIFEQTFTNSIGTSSNGKSLNTLKVVMDGSGNVITAFPKK